MRTNAPALAFVFLGAGLAFIAFDGSYPPKKVEWTVQGSFANVPGKHIDWPTGTLAVHPTDIKPEVSMAAAEMTCRHDDFYSQPVRFSRPLTTAFKSPRLGATTSSS